MKRKSAKWREGRPSTPAGIETLVIEDLEIGHRGEKSEALVRIQAIGLDYRAGNPRSARKPTSARRAIRRGSGTRRRACCWPQGRG